MKRYIIYFLFIGIVLILVSFKAIASDTFELGSAMSNGQWYYQETFSNKRIDNNQVKDKRGNVIWQINTVEGQSNAITDTGALELGDARYMQRAFLTEQLWANKQNYVMEFTINVQKLGNEGNHSRPVAIIIPRSKDKDFNEYYAITYFFENTISNQFKFKWAVINTAAPTKMEPLVEGYYLLRENVDYTARVLIGNTSDENVNIKFYIDGPINPMEEYKPLLEYTDDTDHKILSGVNGPAFGMVGYADSGWGTSPVVRYDNIRLYDYEQFKKYEAELIKYVNINLDDIKKNKRYGQIKYLINRGIMGDFDKFFKPNEYISVMQFLKMMIRLYEKKSPEIQLQCSDNYIMRGIELGLIKENEILDYNKPITKYELALMISRFNNNLFSNSSGSFIKDLLKLIKDSLGGPLYKAYQSSISDFDSIPDKFQDSVLYTYYQGYLRLNNDFRFMGGNLITRSDAAVILLRLLDTGYKQVNYKLELPSILSSGAVLQGNKKIPIWGRGVSGDIITVKFKKQLKTTVVKNGYWSLELAPEPYGGPYTITINGSKDKITLEDIQIGEVFIVAGQSNAEMYLRDCYKAAETREKFLNSSKLRFFSSEKITAVKSEFTCTGNWEYSYDYALDYSPAIGTFFVEKLLELNKELKDVTIGVVEMTYGGTTIEAFMPDSITNQMDYSPKDNEAIMSGFWNGFMAPITPYAIKGLIYYQGENSAHLGYEYESLLRNYLGGLRTEFRDPNLPIMLVQLAGFGYNDYQSNMNEWPIIRGIQLKVANTTDNTGLVTAVDLSDPDPLEIHPKEKKEIGIRLAHLAMNMIYEKGVQGNSAQLRNCLFADDKVIISFDDSYGQIYFKNNVPKDFQILDSQWKWHMADVKLDYRTNMLTIWNDEISEPMGVRYAWVNNPNISLYNKIGFPVLPFRVIVNEKTGENSIKLLNHGLRSNDAILNIDRNNIFRTIQVIDSNMINHIYDISDQTAGDSILKFKRLKESIAQDGTTDTILKIIDHNLSVGDRIRNNSRGWKISRVTAVLDKDTIEVIPIPEQMAGDSIGRYKFVGKAIAK